MTTSVKSCVLFALFVFLSTSILANKSKEKETTYCQAEDKKPVTNFGTHTPYEAADSNTQVDKDKYEVKNCKPEFVWHLVRHGTRYPNKDAIRAMRRILEGLKRPIRENFVAGRAALCEKDMRRLDAWTLEPRESQALDLTTQGQDEEYQLATRFKARFPELLGGGNEDSHEFLYDTSVRTQDSAKWFAKGMLGFTPNLDNKLHPLNDFYKRCPAFKALAKSEGYWMEQAKFENGEEMNLTIWRVSRRLGFVRNLTFEELKYMYEACGFERAWNWRYGKGSPWCAAFQKQDFQVLEYWRDLHEYYRTGYAHRLHVRLGCAAIKELISKLKSKIGGEESKAAVYHFSHDTLINMAISYLGLFKDKIPLKADNFKQLEDRAWRVSRFSPFNSNIAAILYNCSVQDPYRVSVLLGEKAVHLDGCDGKLCSWNILLEKYGSRALESCDLQKLCSNGEDTYGYESAA